jgi:hypothetical protein
LKKIASNDIDYDAYGDVWGENQPGTPPVNTNSIAAPVLRKESSGVVRLHIPNEPETDDPSISLVEKSSTSVRAMPFIPNVDGDRRESGERRSKQNVDENRFISSERRWSAEIAINDHEAAEIFAAAADMSDLDIDDHEDADHDDDSDDDDDDDDDNDNVVIVPMKNDEDHHVPKRKMPKRRGSWDMMPRKPDRRGSSRSLIKEDL